MGRAGAEMRRGAQKHLGISHVPSTMTDTPPELVGPDSQGNRLASSKAARLTVELVELTQLSRRLRLADKKDREVMGHSKRAIAGITGGVLALTVTVYSDVRPDRRRDDTPRFTTPPIDPNPIITTHAGRMSTLRVQRVRLEPAPPSAPDPSAILKFELVNDGPVAVTGVVLEVAVRVRPTTPVESADRRVVAGPFTIRAGVDVHAGYTLNYELLLRNLPADCDCDPDVIVTAARPAPASGEVTPR
jgi:hypothetical protein